MKKQMKKRRKFYRGEIYYVNLDGIGSEERKKRPCVIVQNNIGNKFSPTTIICPISHKYKETKQPTHIRVNSKIVTKKVTGTIMTEQIKVVDKMRIGDKLGELTELGIEKLDKAIKISLDVQD